MSTHLGRCHPIGRAGELCLLSGARVTDPHTLTVHCRATATLRGAPRRVGQCNDLLADAYYASGRDLVNGRHDHKALRSFLRTVIRTGELPTPTSSSRA